MRQGPAYRTSSSPPSQTRKPPSSCFKRPSHCHLESQISHAPLEMPADYDNSHRLSINQRIGILAPDYGKCENRRIAWGKMGDLTMSTTKAAGGILHRSQCFNHAVRVLAWLVRGFMLVTGLDMAGIIALNTGKSNTEQHAKQIKLQTWPTTNKVARTDSPLADSSDILS